MLFFTYIPLIEAYTYLRPMIPISRSFEVHRHENATEISMSRMMQSKISSMLGQYYGCVLHLAICSHTNERWEFGLLSSLKTTATTCTLAISM